MSHFADASAVVKLYADEDGAETVRSLRPLAVSDLTRVEVAAAIWRKVRLAELSALTARVLIDSFLVDFHGTHQLAPRFSSIGLSLSILTEGARLAMTHDVRSMDAIQLACALAARGADPSCDSFACFDRRLRTAAASEGFRVIPERAESEA